jgi:hypothetical protein
MSFVSAANLTASAWTPARSLGAIMIELSQFPRVVTDQGEVNCSRMYDGKLAVARILCLAIGLMEHRHAKFGTEIKRK